MASIPAGGDGGRASTPVGGATPAGGATTPAGGPASTPEVGRQLLASGSCWACTRPGVGWTDPPRGIICSVCREIRLFMADASRLGPLLEEEDWGSIEQSIHGARLFMLEKAE